MQRLFSIALAIQVTFLGSCGVAPVRAQTVFYGTPSHRQPSFVSPRPAAPPVSDQSDRVWLNFSAVEGEFSSSRLRRKFVPDPFESGSPVKIRERLPLPVSYGAQEKTATGRDGAEGFIMGHPNVLIHMTAGTVLSRLQQQRVTRDPVYDVIMGTSLQGTAMSHTTITPQLLPNDRGIEIALHLQTVAQTKTTGKNNAATAYNLGVTEIQGTKKILLTPTRFLTSNARANANTRSNIVKFQWDRHFGEQIARDRAAQQKPITEQISARKAADRARMQLDRQVDRQVIRWEARFRQGVNEQLAALPRLPSQLKFRSTHDTVVAEATFSHDAPNTRFAAQPPPLRINGRCQGIAMQAHQSILDGPLAEWNAALAGKSLAEKDWAGQLANLLPTAPDALKVSNVRRQWKLGMAKQRPVTASLTHEGIHVGLRIEAFQIGTSEYPGMLIETVYAPVIENGKIIARRGEKLQLTPLNLDNAQTLTQANQETANNQKKSKRLGVRQQIFRSLVRKRFDPIFAKEIPIGDQQRTVAGIHLTISKIDLAGEWATVQAIAK